MASLVAKLGYLVNIKDGTPVYDFNSSGNELLTEVDRKIELARDGIPPSGSLLFNENGLVVLIGTEKVFDPSLLRSPRKTYWKTE